MSYISKAKQVQNEVIELLSGTKNFNGIIREKMNEFILSVIQGESVTLEGMHMVKRHKLDYLRLDFGYFLIDLLISDEIIPNADTFILEETFYIKYNQVDAIYKLKNQSGNIISRFKLLCDQHPECLSDFSGF